MRWNPYSVIVAHRLATCMTVLTTNILFQGTERCPVFPMESLALWEAFSWDILGVFSLFTEYKGLTFNMVILPVVYWVEQIDV